MSEDWFFEKFELIAEAPDAVGTMRKLVLQLAVNGRLERQNLNDEPASTLVERAATLVDTAISSAQRLRDFARWQTIADGGLRELPKGWTWTCNALIGNTSPRVSVADDMTVAFAPMNVIPTDYRESLIPETRLWNEVKRGYTHIANGDIVVAKITPCFQNGKACVMRDLLGGVGAGTTELHVLRPFPNTVVPLYMLLFFKSPDFVRGGVATFTGTAGQQRVSNDYFRYCPVPLPPLAEQKRIVAKVDELMALCDQLEAQQQERETRKAGLVRASLARFAEAPTPANLGFVFHKSCDIAPAELRKTILTLAVQGKLVPQDPEVEPAKSRGEHGRAETNGFVIPDSWALSTLTDVAEEVVDCPHSTPKWTTSGKICVRTNQFRPGVLDLTKPKFVSQETFEHRIQRLRPERDDILYSREGGILGIACRVPPKVELCLGQRMMLIRAGKSLSAAFLELVLNSPLICEIARRQTTGGAAPRVNVSTVKAYPIPLPPIAEQRRIVAKVDQLMALVDELERQQETSRTTASRLLDAIVHELTNRN